MIMTRENIFIIWDIENHKFIYNWLWITLWDISNDKLLDWTWEDYYTVLQWIGFKDKNWNNIYEWNVVLVTIKRDDWSVSNYEYLIKDIRYIPEYILHPWSMDITLEVIWNIYENPELFTI